MIFTVSPLWFLSGILSSCARVLTTAAPMRSPVKEPGPDIKVISVRSCQSLPFSASLSWMNLRRFSARSRPDSQMYSWSSNFKIVVGAEVSRYNFII